MIGSELRATAWKYACIAAAVLAVAAVLAALFLGWRGATDRAARTLAESERDAARAQVAALSQARTRDDTAATATEAARATVDQHTADSNDRKTQIEVRYRDRIVEVPAVCPLPDDGLMREHAAQRQRVLAAEDRLRRTRPAAQDVAR